jgi:hypothetical protein
MNARRPESHRSHDVEPQPRQGARASAALAKGMRFGRGCRVEGGKLPREQHLPDIGTSFSIQYLTEDSGRLEAPARSLRAGAWHRAHRPQSGKSEGSEQFVKHWCWLMRQRLTRSRSDGQVARNLTGRRYSASERGTHAFLMMGAFASATTPPNGPCAGLHSDDGHGCSPTSGAAWSRAPTLRSSKAR